MLKRSAVVHHVTMPMMSSFSTSSTGVCTSTCVSEENGLAWQRRWVKSVAVVEAVDNGFQRATWSPLLVLSFHHLLVSNLCLPALPSQRSAMTFCALLMATGQISSVALQCRFRQCSLMMGRSGCRGPKIWTYWNGYCLVQSLVIWAKNRPPSDPLLYLTSTAS